MDLHRVKMMGNACNASDLESPSLFKGLTNFDRHEQRRWFQENWTIAFYFVAAYVLFIYMGQEFMKNRKPMNLKKPIIIWNTLLAIFSIVACCKLLPEFYDILAGVDGGHKSVCASCQEVSDQGLYWGWLFTLSKVVELGDTIFLILRKRRLIFLHWYHHITVLSYCWYVYAAQISTARWFICVNYSIHAIMYTYYAIRSLNIRIPKKIAMTITSLQLSQMVIGVIVNVYAYLMKSRGVDCDVSVYHLNFGLIMYASYFFLFAHFFHKAYLSQRKGIRDKGADRLRMEVVDDESCSADVNANFVSKKQSVNSMMMVNGNKKMGMKVD